MGIGSILGGLAGLLIPGGGALFSALGSGLGSLVIDKASPKDAIKNALFAGAGSKLFGSSVANSAMGKTATSGLASLGIGTAEQIQAINAAKGAAVAGATSNAISPTLLYSGLSLAAAAADSDGNAGIPERFLDRYTGRPFDTPEARDDYERRWRDAQNAKRGYEHYQPYDGPRSSFEGFQGAYRGNQFDSVALAKGGYIEGPGTGTSDSINAEIRQGGVPVQKALLSDGEFVMTEKAVTNAGNGDREKGAAKMYAMMRDFERGQA